MRFAAMLSIHQISNYLQQHHSAANIVGFECAMVGMEPTAANIARALASQDGGHLSMRDTAMALYFSGQRQVPPQRVATALYSRSVVDLPSLSLAMALMDVANIPKQTVGKVLRHWLDRPEDEVAAVLAQIQI